MFDIIYRYDPGQPSERRNPVDAGEACRRLEEGNRLFASMTADAVDGCRIVPIDLEDMGVGAPGDILKQQPFAVVLGCADARVPIEVIFERTCNELFVVRVAGNILGQEQLGSIDYAVGHFGSNLKAIVVLGHSHCGAVTAAVDSFLRPVEYLGLVSSHQIRSIVNAIFPAVRGAALSLSRILGDEVSTLPGYRAALIECSVVFNAALTAAILGKTFGEPAKDCRVVFGVYDLGTRRVHVPQDPEREKEPMVGLHEALSTHEELRELAARVVSSGHIRKILDGE
jgi:carbonic anhydrase